MDPSRVSNFENNSPGNTTQPLNFDAYYTLSWRSFDGIFRV